MPEILVLEDEAIIARNLCEILRRAGHVVTQAGSVAEGRARIGAARFDLVLADISLGDGDGISLLADQAERLGDTPVIVMTGQDNVANRLRAERIAVAGFMAKPFAMARVRDLVSALLAGRPGTMSPQRGPCVMMYSHDTIGLGHLRRNTAIARELVSRVRGVSVLLLVGCPAGMVFDPSPGIDYVKLPSLTKVGRGAWAAGSLRIDADTTRAIRAGILERVIETFAPEVLLVDHEPSGVWNELVAPIEKLRKTGRGRTVLGLRDILDDPDRVAAAWRATGTDRVIAELYDEVLIYGNEAFFPSDRAYGLQALRPGHVRYCGAVTAASAGQRERWQGAPRRVLVSGGGGRDAYELIDTALSALGLIDFRLRPEMTVVAGPLMDDELRTALEKKAAEVGAIYHRSVTDMPERMDRADLFITMGGYNSVAEALATGCRAVIVPRVGPSAEQRIRADRLAELGMAEVIHRANLNPARLARCLVSRPGPSQASPALDFDGAVRAAEAIAALLPAERPALSVPPNATFAKAQSHA